MSSEIKADKWSPASGTSATIGDSGDTYTVPSGVTLNTSSATLTLPSTVITGQTAKTSLVDADKFLISDSAASGALKYVEKQYLPSGGLVKLIGGSASSSVNHDFQNFMDSSKYNVYLVNLQQVTNGSGSNERIDLQFIANTTLLNGSHYWGAVQGYRSGNSEYTDAYESGTRARLGVPLIMNDANRGNFRFYINVDTSRDFGVSLFGNNWGYNSSFGDYVFTNFTSGYNSTATVTGIRLFESGDNAITFNYEIYGIAK